jgi:hypothetical protein
MKVDTVFHGLLRKRVKRGDRCIEMSKKIAAFSAAEV